MSAKYIYFLIAILIIILLTFGTESIKEIRDKILYSLLSQPEKICRELIVPETNSKALTLYKCLDENNEQIYRLITDQDKEGEFWYFDQEANLIAHGEWSYLPRFDGAYQYCYKTADKKICPDYTCAKEIICQPK